MQGQLRYEPLSVSIRTECTQSGRPIHLELDRDLNYTVHERGAVPLIFVPLVDFDRLAEYGRKRIALVTVSGASNVLGICNDLTEISQIVHRYGARLLVDAAQLVAHRKVEVDRWGIDYLAFSAHKVYAPFGSGALLVRKGLLHFSPAERALIQASGEENVGGIALTSRNKWAKSPGLRPGKSSPSQRCWRWGLHESDLN